MKNQTAISANREPLVLRTIGSLSGELLLLEQQMDELEMRLADVMSDPAPREESQKETDFADLTCPMASTLQDKAHSIRCQRERIEGLISRLEV